MQPMTRTRYVVAPNGAIIVETHDGKPPLQGKQVASYDEAKRLSDEIRLTHTHTLPNDDQPQAQRATGGEGSSTNQPCSVSTPSVNSVGEGAGINFFHPGAAPALFETTRALAMTLWGASIILPSGTEVMPVVNGMGNTEYAVRSQGLLIDLTGNGHDPIYRYAFVPSDAVGEASEMALIEDLV